MLRRSSSSRGKTGGKLLQESSPSLDKDDKSITSKESQKSERKNWFGRSSRSIDKDDKSIESGSQRSESHKSRRSRRRTSVKDEEEGSLTKSTASEASSSKAGLDNFQLPTWETPGDLLNDDLLAEPIVDEDPLENMVVCFNQSTASFLDDITCADEDFLSPTENSRSARRQSRSRLKSDLNMSNESAARRRRMKSTGGSQPSRQSFVDRNMSNESVARRRRMKSTGVSQPSQRSLDGPTNYENLERRKRMPSTASQQSIDVPTKSPARQYRLDKSSSESLRYRLDKSSSESRTVRLDFENSGDSMRFSSTASEYSGTEPSTRSASPKPRHRHYASSQAPPGSSNKARPESSREEEMVALAIERSLLEPKPAKPSNLRPSSFAISSEPVPQPTNEGLSNKPEKACIWKKGPNNRYVKVPIEDFEAEQENPTDSATGQICGIEEIIPESCRQEARGKTGSQSVKPSIQDGSYQTPSARRVLPGSSRSRVNEEKEALVHNVIARSQRGSHRMTAVSPQTMLEEAVEASRYEAQRAQIDNAAAQEQEMIQRAIRQSLQENTAQCYRGSAGGSAMGHSYWPLNEERGQVFDDHVPVGRQTDSEGNSFIWKKGLNNKYFKCPIDPTDLVEDGNHSSTSVSSPPDETEAHRVQRMKEEMIQEALERSMHSV